jgi:hypothetical protein
MNGKSSNHLPLYSLPSREGNVISDNLGKTTKKK